MKSIKNMVIAEALKLGGHHFFQEISDQESDVPRQSQDEQEEETVLEEREGEDILPDPAGEQETEESLPEEEEPVREEGWENTGKAEWSQQYKQARKYLYGSETTEPDFTEAIADEHGGKLPNRVVIFGDEIGTIPKIESLEMLFSAGRSRRISMVPIIQSFAQLQKNYGKEGSFFKMAGSCQVRFSHESDEFPPGGESVFLVNPGGVHGGPSRRTHSNKDLWAEKEIKSQYLKVRK